MNKQELLAHHKQKLKYYRSEVYTTNEGENPGYYHMCQDNVRGYKEKVKELETKGGK